MERKVLNKLRNIKIFPLLYMMLFRKGQGIIAKLALISSDHIHALEW
jgi:hypothetical protein